MRRAARAAASAARPGSSRRRRARATASSGAERRSSGAPPSAVRARTRRSAPAALHEPPQPGARSSRLRAFGIEQREQQIAVEHRDERSAASARVARGFADAAAERVADVRHERVVQREQRLAQRRAQLLALEQPAHERAIARSFSRPRARRRDEDLEHALARRDVLEAGLELSEERHEHAPERLAEQRPLSPKCQNTARATDARVRARSRRCSCPRSRACEQRDAAAATMRSWVSSLRRARARRVAWGSRSRCARQQSTRASAARCGAAPRCRGTARASSARRSPRAPSASSARARPEHARDARERRGAPRPEQQQRAHAFGELFAQPRALRAAALVRAQERQRQPAAARAERERAHDVERARGSRPTRSSRVRRAARTTTRAAVGMPHSRSIAPSARWRARAAQRLDAGHEVPPAPDDVDPLDARRAQPRERRGREAAAGLLRDHRHAAARRTSVGDRRRGRRGSRGRLRPAPAPARRSGARRARRRRSPRRAPPRAAGPDSRACTTPTLPSSSTSGASSRTR